MSGTDWPLAITEHGWYVPGVAYDDGAHTVRLYMPTGWRRDIIEVKRTPLSMNNNEIRSSWRGFQKHKKSWQDEIGLMLMYAQLPRRNQRAVAGAIMRFEKTAPRRDEGNFSQLVNKALGDALVIDPDMPERMRYIPDDHTPYYLFAGVEFEEEIGPARTLIYLYSQPEQED